MGINADIAQATADLDASKVRFMMSKEQYAAMSDMLAQTAAASTRAGLEHAKRADDRVRAIVREELDARGL